MNSGRQRIVTSIREPFSISSRYNGPSDHLGYCYGVGKRVSKQQCTANILEGIVEDRLQERRLEAKFHPVRAGHKA